MAPIAFVSQTELAERRQQLRRHRRLKLLQDSWRVLAICGLTVGSVWLTTRPVWVIRAPSQVSIQGNQLLSMEAIQSLLPIQYPQGLLDIQPQAIAAHLEAQAPIAQATVSRHLIPPGLTVQVQERKPVAVALPDRPEAQSSGAVQDSTRIGVPDPSRTGLLDESGTWIPLDSFTTLNQSMELPALKVRGMREEYRDEWPELYEAVRQSPVKVLEIDWRQPSNLILHTELGIVHFGPYSSQFPRQLVALDQMRELPKHLNGQKIAYISLQNPNSPVLKMASGQ